MDYTDYDIANIDLGDKWLSMYLVDPELFNMRLRESMPLRFCLCEIFRTLVRIGAAPTWDKQRETKLFVDALAEAKRLWHSSTSEQHEMMAKCIFVLNHFAEKRLSTTTGV